MDRHVVLTESSRPMRHLLPLLLVAVACSSGQKKSTWQEEAQSRVSQGPPLPAPPPLGPDQSTAKVTGCSDSQSPSEADAATFPPQVLGSKAPSATEVQLGTQPAGVWVNNNLTHPCCTKTKVFVQRSQGAVNFLEMVEGTPCGEGCMCTSSVQAAAGVPPGRYNVAVRVEDTAGSTIVKTSNFVIEAY